MADIIGRIFGNEPRAKLLRFLILNDQKSHSLLELEKKIGLTSRDIRKEAIALRKAGIIKGKSVYEALRGGGKISKVRTLALFANPQFKYLRAIKDVFSATTGLSVEDLVKRLGQGSKMKLVITSGVFVENPEGRLDLLIVGDKLDKEALDKAIHGIEKTLGRDLRYATLETADFTYRISVYDRLIRDVLDYPHIKILNRMSV